MLNKAQDAATKTGAAITNKRVSITDSPLKIVKLNTENNINIRLYYCILTLYIKSLKNYTYYYIMVCLIFALVSIENFL